MKTLVSVQEASELIESGARLMVAGDEKLLSALPKGDWIGGTTPYFMTEEGGICSREKLHVVQFPPTVLSVKAHMYTAQHLKLIPKDYKSNGFAIAIVPAYSDVHTTFAKDSSSWPDVFALPLIGWVAGKHLEDPESVSSKVFNGQTGEVSETKAVVLHAELASHLTARMNTINLFQMGRGDAISFPQGAFETTDCKVNGETRNFAEYLLETGASLDTPLVANYFGALVNVSIRAIDKELKKVSFFSPIFPGIHYKFALPVENYPETYQTRLNINQLWAGDPVYSCNCILNYLEAELEGKKSGKMQGPVVFGEIAYMLLNHTMVYLTFEPK